MARKVPETLQTVKVITTAVRCMLELDDKNLCLRIYQVHTVTAGHGEIKLRLNWNSHPAGCISWCQKEPCRLLVGNYY